MKLLLFIIPALLLLVISPVSAQLSDSTGLINRLDIETSGYTFEVKTTANFDVIDHEFSKDEKRLTIFISSGLENNLGEITIPQELLGGNFTFYLNDVEYNPKIQSNDRITFLTLEFNGTGHNQLDIIGTRVFAQTTADTPKISDTDDGLSSDNGGGCLVATATYGTELATQVQQLREIREQQLMRTESGQLFLHSFNGFYYSFSPFIADLEREYPVLKDIIKVGITPLLSTLFIMEHAESDSQVLAYGTGVILINIGMYFLAPAVVIVRLVRQ